MSGNPDLRSGILSLSRQPMGGTLGQHRMQRGAPGMRVGATVAYQA
jgi:hypothetical protein